ncbi:MAG: bifunctional homocysteine S-methyltransferase/methylenetetrahydrofolate reductase [Clostridiaceae bacterium]|jgi:homocysteine S-methyltransferase|nr:bifunctional homocysteine S-methyltransferase/methylenetetrahydrofolate reductase [Clostridiaceae bacterium]
MILYDGAMGTYYRWLHKEDNALLEEVNLSNPDRIKQIHQAYIKAGATKIKTNTFAAFPLMLEKTEAEVKKIVRAAWHIANEAINELNAREFVKVVGDIGPFFLLQPGLDDVQAQNEKAYLDLVKIFLDIGVNEFLFETQEQLSELLPAIQLIAKYNPQAKITVAFSVNQNGFTRTGLRLRDLLAEAEKIPQITFTGLNCNLGPTMLSQVFVEHANFSKFCYFGPNSGLPERDLGRGRGGAEAEYFAKSCQRAWDYGAYQLGGCCGTNPLDIRALSDIFKKQKRGTLRQTDFKTPTDSEKQKISDGYISSEHISAKIDLQAISEDSKISISQQTKSWYEKLLAGEQIIAIEYDTPTKADTDTYLKKIAQLQAAGMDLMTIADNPNGQTRIDSALMAARIKNELKVEVLPHFTCRDRNLVAIHSLLLGLVTCGVHQVLAVTGDPIPLEDRNQVKSVFNVNSQSLLRYISQLNEELAQPFILCAALNVNVPRFDKEMKKTLHKVEAGAQVFLTQPIFTDQARENLALAKQELGDQIKILAGVMPLVSQKNALFMKYEMSGIDIPDRIIDLYANKTREEAENLALQIAGDAMYKLSESADGFYLITPFQRTHLTAQLCREWKEKGLEKEQFKS